MHAANTTNSRALVLKAPTFIVINNTVHFDMGGFHGILHDGEKVEYKKHGLFRAEYIGHSYAVIDHVTVLGAVMKIFIPPEKRLWASNGHFMIDEVNDYKNWQKVLGGEHREKAQVTDKAFKMPAVSK